MHRAHGLDRIAEAFVRFIILPAILFAMALGAPLQSGEMANPIGPPDREKELIVLAAPPDGDDYYADVRQDIHDFHVSYARQIATRDDVLILSGSEDYDAYVADLGAEKVLNVQMLDIWMRDFSPLNAIKPVMFRYTAAGQGGGRKGQADADHVQDALADLIKAAGGDVAESNLFNDGGNYVDDYAGNAVLSRKFLRDNKLSETEARRRIKEAAGVSQIAFIDADEQGGLEHADGVVAFIGENTLVINSYPEDPEYAATLRADLQAGLPGVVLHEIVTPYDGRQIYDKRFGSACGLYTNMLVTPSRIYFPQFGIPEDAVALASIKSWTDRDVVPVQSGHVCKMGGGVRCMSWQARGPLADTLRDYAARK
ncbi:MAG: agmatine deiminase family protein [Pseudomonadota bacterium]